MTEFNLMRIPSLDTWRDNLSTKLDAFLPDGTAVEFVAESVPVSGEIGRFIRIHLAGRDAVRVNIKFVEPLHVIMERVAEAIK